MESRLAERQRPAAQRNQDVGNEIKLDPDNPVVKLCVEGMQAEGDGDLTKARALFEKAFEGATDDFERCIAAHYLARHQTTPDETLRWNHDAMRYAASVDDDRVEDFYPSLLLNLAHSYEQLGNRADAQQYYKQAVSRADALPEGRYGKIVRDAARAGQQRVAESRE